MKTDRSNNREADIPEEINGLRMTRQRQEVYRFLKNKRTHPTANEVFISLQKSLPNVSLATVYNCLEALVQHEIVRQVNFDREPSRYCSNLEEHGHFHDETTGTIHDIKFKPGVNLADLLDLPPNTLIKDVEITLRGQLA
jgi:Fe2+ or Zn2+ uptake regulation protein